jgi:enoyl-[acyl-carrier-protein] reductase (NADH)
VAAADRKLKASKASSDGCQRKPGFVKSGPETDDIVGTALYLASDLSDFVTGENVTVDGGAML